MIQTVFDANTLIPIGSVLVGVGAIVGATWKVRGYLETNREETRTAIEEQAQASRVERAELIRAVDRLALNVEDLTRKLNNHVTRSQLILWIERLDSANDDLTVPKLERE